jgi:hypothetical protein
MENKKEYLSRLIQLAPLKAEERTAWSFMLPFMDDAQVEKLTKILESDTQKMAEALNNAK